MLLVISVLPYKTRVFMGLNLGYLDCSSHMFPGCAIAQVFSHNLSVWRCGFNFWSFHVGLVVVTVTLGHVFL
jgi:hypothetical protein